MDYLFTPWRYQYISSIKPDSACIFCLAGSPPEAQQNFSAEQLQKLDEERHVIFRARLSFVILNRYPYTNGHLMIAPFQHIPDLASCSAPLLGEMMELAQRAEAALKEIYKPDGFNVGLNLGKCAGAGVEDHLHLHILPRWAGDTNFLSVVGETRLLPESLEITYQKLQPFFQSK
ncbi:MAG: HIT domain-containing protein [Acidobacteriia bacterium]|nr:HIT domain-containing protein [Terriglobia bacterium]